MKTHLVASHNLVQAVIMGKVHAEVFRVLQ